MSNTGKGLETTLTAIFDEYERLGKARIRKVDPPCKIVGTGKFRRVIFLDNPFLDYAGTWRERRGRSIFLEAKSTTKPVLPFTTDDGNGLRTKQVNNLEVWQHMGAAVGVLWELHGGEIRFVSIAAVRSQINAGVKHLKWENATPIPRGLGFVMFDVLGILARYYPEQPAP